jgi:MFS family permease
MASVSIKIVKKYQGNEIATTSYQKHHAIFYGWWIVGACFLISLYTAGAISYGFTAFFEPIADEMGWSYAAISLAASIRGVESGFLTPVIGILVDRFGPRRLVFSGAILIGVSFILLSRVTSLLTFYGVFVLLSIGFCTCTSTVTMTAVTNWFRRKNSLAVGIMSCGTGVGGLMIPLLVWLIGIFQWRTSIIIVGISAWVIMLPLSFIIRHKPEQYGYLPDGDTIPVSVGTKESSSIISDEVYAGLKQILKKRAFWHISLGFCMHMIAMSMVTIHIIPYLTTVGIQRTTSGFMVSGLYLASIMGRIGFGWFGDRFDKRLVTGTAFLILFLGIFLLNYSFSNEISYLLFIMILLGLGTGGPIPMTAALLRKYFGIVRLGSILGLVFCIIWIGGIIGPPIAGWTFDNFHSYKIAWLVGIITTASATLLMVTSPKN